MAAAEKGKGRRRATSTSNFGVGKRESHDASAFYSRFPAPVLSDREEVRVSAVPEPCLLGDARKMGEHLEPDSVALVVTSPPYFAGKEYEQALGEGGVPESYARYLQMLEEVFAACVEVLEPGGRIAVNVANLGRRPYRSLSADVVGILERLGLLLRGEVLWVKARGASGSCAWGSYRSPRNPVLRDLTERVVIASKGRFDRALTPGQREERGLPHQVTMTADEFMASTLDLWEIPPESARRVGHPAPFPVELPQRLIELYTFRGDLVLDPFMGVGTTLVAAARSGRRGVGFDTDPEYVEAARARLSAEERALEEAPEAAPADPSQRLAAFAEELLVESGFEVVGRKVRPRGTGLVLAFELADQVGGRWYVDLSGAQVRSDPRAGLRGPVAVQEALGRALVLERTRSPGGPPLLHMSSHLPQRGPARRQLHLAGCGTFYDVLELGDPAVRGRLAEYARRGAGEGPLPGFWSLPETGDWHPGEEGA